MYEYRFNQGLVYQLHFNFFFNVKFTRFASSSNSGNQCFLHFLLISYR